MNPLCNTIDDFMEDVSAHPDCFAIFTKIDYTDYHWLYVACYDIAAVMVDE